MKKIYLYFVLLLGITMTAIGGWLLFNPSTSLRALTITIAIILVLNGLNEMISYFQGNKVWKLSRWNLFDGILSLVIGLFIFMNTQIAERIFIIIFAIWVLASAILHILIAFSVKGFPGWTILLIMGIITLILAIISLFTNTIVAITVAFIIGAFFIVQGLTWLSLWWALKKTA